MVKWGRWSYSSTQSLFFVSALSLSHLPPGKATRYLLSRKLGMSQSRSRRFGEHKVSCSCPCEESNIHFSVVEPVTEPLYRMTHSGCGRCVSSSCDRTVLQMKLINALKQRKLRRNMNKLQYCRTCQKAAAVQSREVFRFYLVLQSMSLPE